jgi:hypothetical protein
VLLWRSLSNSTPPSTSTCGKPSKKGVKEAITAKLEELRTFVERNLEIDATRFSQLISFDGVHLVEVSRANIPVHNPESGTEVTISADVNARLIVVAEPWNFGFFFSKKFRVGVAPEVEALPPSPGPTRQEYETTLEIDFTATFTGKEYIDLKPMGVRLKY